MSPWDPGNVAGHALGLCADPFCSSSVMSLEAHLEIFYLHFILEKNIQIWCSVDLSVPGSLGEDRRWHRAAPKAIHHPLRTSHLTLELDSLRSDPEPWATGAMPSLGCHWREGQELGGTWTV